MVYKNPLFLCLVTLTFDLLPFDPEINGFP